MTAIGYPDTDVHEDVWGDDEHLWGPDVKGLGLDDEIEDIELGWRVSWWATSSMLASVLATEESRIRSTATVMVGEVAEATSRRGLRFPPEWWPPSAGPYQDVRADEST